jgi:hypothetical protein
MLKVTGGVAESMANVAKAGAHKQVLLIAGGTRRCSFGTREHKCIF